MIDANLIDFFIGSKRSVVQLDTLEISHPLLSQVYRFVRNARQGVTATDENSVSRFFRYMPMKVEFNGARDDMDSGMKIALGDLGEQFPKELDRIREADGFRIKPRCTYRAYRSDQLTSILIGPYFYETKAWVFDSSGVSFEASAPGMNYSQTGQLYTIGRFPMLRGAL